MEKLKNILHANKYM